MWGKPDRSLLRTSHFYKCLSTYACSTTRLLTDVYQRSLDRGELPSDWKEANICAAYKKGERYKASNYRPISLTAICCKMLEHIIASNLMKHLEYNNMLFDLQHGFRQHRSCETQLLSLTHQSTQARQAKVQTDMIVMDFAKAFDKVSHSRLMLKLHWLGVRGNTHRWIQDFLTDRSQRVVLDHDSSEVAPVTSGMPQGTALGPVLFLVYIYDLSDRVKHSTVHLFADDCVLQKEIRTTADAEALQQDINHLAQWEQDWLMEFHPQKCEVMTLPASR